MSTDPDAKRIMELIDPVYDQMKKIVKEEPTCIGIGAVSKLWHTATKIAIEHLLENIGDLDAVEVAKSIVVLSEASEATALQYAAYFNALTSDGLGKQGDSPISSDDLDSAKEAIDSICKKLFEGGDE